MSFDGEDPSTTISCLRKARKEHRCCECYRWIVPSETYEYISGVWDGHGDSFKTYIECAEIRKEVADHAHQQYGFGYNLIFGQLREELDFWCGEQA